jgi:hypothetical protein
MGVKKYHSVGEMPGRPALRPLDPDNLLRVLELCAFTDWLFPVQREPGVRKFRSLEEANRHRHEWEAEAIRKQRAARSVPAGSEALQPEGRAIPAAASGGLSSAAKKRSASGTPPEKGVG